jgi:diguanylate cyclase (GGDEF)-like protein
VRQDVPGHGQPTRVLLIEDDPRAATLIGAMLRATWTEGLVLSHTERLSDGTQELVDGLANCVLLGLSADDPHPLESLDQLRAAAPEAAIVALTDGTEEMLALSAIRAGAQDCLIKGDLNPARLRRAVGYAIERKRSELRLAHQALHDPLTGLPNRALFLDRLGVALDRSRRTSGTVAVLFLDVDNFKDINDSFGHAAGDRLLSELSDRLRSMLRPMDTVARFGGDEFTFLFEELGSDREVVLIAERISRVASAPFLLEAGEVTTTVSIGITTVVDPAVPAEAVIREADAAMYRAKELGGSRFELFDEESRRRALDRLELETELRYALDRQQLRVHYQPNFALNGSATVIGFEALVRWEHPQRGLIAPMEFIPLAEETGSVVEIGRFVLEQALTHAVHWRRSNPALTVSVNLSPRQLEDTGLPAMVQGAIDATGCPPEALCLEVTEQAIAHRPDLAVRVLSGLKAVGVKIAIDDYGTGSSLLSSLRQLPLDTLKIHESFIGGLGSDPDGATIIGAVVELGHGLGLGVAAEGVETDAQRAQLQALGCDSAQGYLFSPAVPGQQAEALLAHS